ncbi:MAG: hypothetical protein ACWGN2_03820 [Anaerolineales bacterium]
MKPGTYKLSITSLLLLILFLPLVLGQSTFAQEVGDTVPIPDTGFIAESNSAPPTAPPDASKINVGSPNTDGYAVVNAYSGAVPGNVSVAITNLNTRNVITTTANASGGFQATLFAPPGSTLLVKYSPDPEPINALWNDALNPGGDFSYMNPLPGTTVFVPGSNPGTPGMPFHSSGFFGPGEGPDWAGWWVNGTAAGPGGTSDLNLQPGQQVTVTGKFFVTSPGMNCSNPPAFTPQLHFHLNDLFGPDGKAILRGPWFSSFLFTPTGLPIEHEGPPEAIPLISAAVTGLSCINSDTAQGNYSTTFNIPSGVADGVYKLDAYLDDGGVPLASGVRKVVIWYHFDPFAALPVIKIGSPEPPRIPWTLFSDYTTNGHRGVQANENKGVYQMVTRTIYPPHNVVLPMIDERSNQPITYRLEPGSNWITSTDRRFPPPLVFPLKFPGGSIQAEVYKPDGSTDVIGPAPIMQSSVRTPSLPDGTIMHEGTGNVGDIFHLYASDPGFAYSFDQYGHHTITLSGYVEDIYGNQYPINNSYDLMIARVLDLDPAQLPTTPYQQGDAFAPGLHIFPPMPAEVEIRVTHLPLSNQDNAQETLITGKANRFGYFQPAPGTEIRFNSPGEFRVDISAEYEAEDGTRWAGYLTWGNVIEGNSPLIEAHGRRGMDYHTDTINDMPPWFRNQDLPLDKIGIENYYPYFSGDIHWGEELAPPSRRGDSIHSIITLRDLTGANETIYNLIRSYYPRANNYFREPPEDHTLTGLEKRLDIHEAPLFITTSSGRVPTKYPDEIDMWGYWYGSSERPDVHVREIISEDGMGTAYWRFNDTYGYQIGEPADGDHPGDIKWEFGGVVFRVPGQGINEYAIYSSLWVLLPEGCDAYGCTRVTAPFQGTTGAGINGGPIMSLLGKDIDMLFLPKGIRPGDVLELGDTIAFSGHVGPPLDSRVEVTITSPTGVIRNKTWHANEIGWLYDPTFDFAADEVGRWTVNVFVEHDRPYIGNGVTPTSHNSGTVLGTNGQFEFYVVEPSSDPLTIVTPFPGFIPLPTNSIEPITIRGIVPAGTDKVHYTIHDKGIVMGQGSLTPNANGLFSFNYDPEALHNKFSMLSLTAHEGRRLGLADEVSINILATGAHSRANTVTFIGEEVFVGSVPLGTYLPLLINR